MDIPVIEEATGSEPLEEGGDQPLEPLSLTEADDVVKDTIEQQLADTSISYQDSSLPVSWKNAKKHVFVLSEAGKPIYSRNGEEEALVTLFAVMQAIFSVVEDEGDSVQSFKAGSCLIVFRKQGPLIFVAVSKGAESEALLATHLHYVYNQILTVLTSNHLAKIFNERRNYDLRRLLSGSERLINSLLNYIESDASVLLNSIVYLTMPSSERDTVSNAISSTFHKTKTVVFAILMVNNRLVTIVRMNKYLLKVTDLHLILNLINSTESFKAAESWTPICLPDFDCSGFLHLYVSYLKEGFPICLALITTDRDSFYKLSDGKCRIVEKLEKNNMIENIMKHYSEPPNFLKGVDSSDVIHFVYKNQSLSQAIISEYGLSYRTEEDKQEILNNYISIYHNITTTSRHHKLLLKGDNKEITVGWRTQSFELLATFIPLSTKAQVVCAINNLLKWIKKEEDKVFQLQAPSF
ncbi:protein SAND-like [Artemia franciscana]|uniref:Vacuolar fusion protein MON1 homolog n=1 Tax=Artemia franciscana TaxID=6661 RepID=A0AA88H7V3_ARTSF|nr:hypothetical protein QYM36_017347 [Artemia franciscana]KAK2705275.1 hypothetical protein QYM36_017347 [Artemia franciscana]KAK2705276.1 hypothetical protein QYM36_017347 [Artemia franciscana]